MSTLEPTIDPLTASPSDGVTRPATGGVGGALAEIATSSDHKVIARDLVGTALLGLLGAVVCGVLLAIDRIGGESTVLGTDIVPEMLNGYRVGLVLGGVAPLLLGICAFAVPLQVGSRSLAFPRFAALGVWTWLGGLGVFAVALAFRGGGGGEDFKMVWLSIAALATMAIGLVAVAIPIATTVLTSRAPGMRLQRAPFFAWSALVYSLGLALVLPVFVAACVYVYIGNRYATTGVMGESTDIIRRAWWLFSGPALALFVVPVAGFFVEVVGPTFRKRVPMRFAAFTGIALVGIGGLAGVMQQRTLRLPGTGTAVSLDNFATKFAFLAVWGLFTVVPLLGVALAAGALALTGKPPTKLERRQGAESVRPRPSAAAAFAVLGLLIAALGLLGNALNGIEDLGLIGTVFEEGATTALVYGGVLAAAGAIVWWLPKYTGRKISDVQAVGIALLGAGGAALASLPYGVAGFVDQPQVAGFLEQPQIAGSYDIAAISTSWTNDGPGELLNGLVAVGHGLVAVAVLGLLALVLRNLAGTGEEAGENPWEGQTLDWMTGSPVPADNFVTTPTVRSPEPVLDAVAASEEADS